MPSGKADYSVRIVTDDGQADARVIVVDGISDLSPSAGDSLFFDGTNWVDRPIADGDVPAGVARDAEVAALLPWLIDVDVFHTPIDSLNFDTLAATGTYIYGGFRACVATQDAYIALDVVLAAGTWTFELLGDKDQGRGIATFSLDGVDVGTVDFYTAGAEVVNFLGAATGIVVAATGKKRLKITCKTKNAGVGSAFTLILQHLQLRRMA